MVRDRDLAAELLAGAADLVLQPVVACVARREVPASRSVRPGSEPAVALIDR